MVIGADGRTVEHMFEVIAAELEGVIDRLSACVVPADGPSILRLRAALDRFEAVLGEVEVQFDASESWRDDGAGSLRAWLVGPAGLGRRAATGAARRIERLEAWPEVRSAWLEGRVHGAQVDTLVAVVPARFVDRFSDDAAMVLDAVSELDVADTETVVRQWVRMAESADDAAAFVERPSGVHLDATFGGRVALSGDLDPTAGAIVAAALRVFDVPDALDARGEPIGPARTSAQRRADALVEVCRFALAHRDGAGESGRFLPQVSLVVEVGELRAAALRGAGVSSHADLDRVAEGAGWSAVERAWFADALARHGDGSTNEGAPVDAAGVSMLSCESVVSKVLLAGSKVLDLGREVRTATAAQRRAIIARDRHCRAPGCRTGPMHCDVHHVDHWALGGRSDVGRMVLLCGTHHRLFHRSGYRMEFDDDGRFTVHLPDGRWSSSVPAGVGPPVFARAVAERAGG